MVFAIPPPMNFNRIMQVPILCLAPIPLLFIIHDKREQGQSGSMKENGILKFSFSYYFQPFEWQNFLELLGSNRMYWLEFYCLSVLSPHYPEKVVVEGNTAQWQKKEKVWQVEGMDLIGTEQIVRP